MKKALAFLLAMVLLLLAVGCDKDGKSKYSDDGQVTVWLRTKSVLASADGVFSQEINYEYDDQGRMVEYTNSYSWVGSYPTDWKTIRYDKNGRIMEVNLGKSSGLPEGVGNQPHTQHKIEYNDDETEIVITITYFKSLTDSVVTSTTLVYDDYGNLLKMVGDNSFTQEYVYDRHGNEIKHTSSYNGTVTKVVVYEYDDSNRKVKQEQYNNGTLAYRQIYTYDSNNNVSTLEHYSCSENETTLDYHKQYEYDKNNCLIKEAIYYTENSVNNSITEHTYKKVTMSADQANRLKIDEWLVGQGGINAWYVIEE